MSLARDLFMAALSKVEPLSFPEYWRMEVRDAVSSMVDVSATKYLVWKQVEAWAGQGEKFNG
jgi:hypothetical protein